MLLLEVFWLLYTGDTFSNRRFSGSGGKYLKGHASVFESFTPLIVYLLHTSLVSPNGVRMKRRCLKSLCYHLTSSTFSFSHVILGVETEMSGDVVKRVNS